jgi:hypothetical protein
MERCPRPGCIPATSTRETSSSWLEGDGPPRPAASRSEGKRDLRAILETLDPNDLRRVLIHDHADPDAISSQLLRYRDDRGDDRAHIIDFLTMYPEARRRVVRILGEIDATSFGA